MPEVTVNYALDKITLSQDKSFEPFFIVNLRVKTNNLQNNSYAEITDARGKLYVIKGSKEFELGDIRFEDRLIVRQEYEMHAIARVRVTPYVFHKIEDLRNGDEMYFRANLIFGTAIVRLNNIESQATLQFNVYPTNQWLYPKSEWVKDLNTTDFHKIELIEIPKIEFPELPLTSNIMRFVEDAKTSMNEGKHGDVLSKCRKALDALDGGIDEWGKKLELNDKENSKREQILTKLFGEKEKAKRFNEIKNKFHSYLSLDPHEPQYKGIEFTREDAKFVLVTSITIINNVLQHMKNQS